MIFLGTLIDKTENIKLGTGVINIPSYHPVHVAAQVAMMDHLLNGRMLMGIGPGGLPVGHRGVREPGHRQERKRWSRASTRCWRSGPASPPYNLEGKFYKTSTERTLYPEIGQGIVPKPLQKPHPPIVFTALAPYSKGITAAAERGWTGISSNYVQDHWVATHIPKFVEGQRNAGLPEDPSLWRIAKSIMVCDDGADAVLYARSEDGPYGFYFSNLMKKIARGRGAQGLGAVQVSPGPARRRGFGPATPSTPR